MRKHFPKGVGGAVVVAALGYFVDVYDLLIFSIVRVASLKSIGVPDESMMRDGLFLLNAQMGGMLLGGIFWGVLGDKKGRLSVLLGSIFLYSIANIANGFVTSVNEYAFWRFLAGVGLAGELGAGITLVAELMPRESRGFGTTLVASIGVGGAIFAAFVGEHVSWKTAYFLGGGFGLSLLFLRVAVNESGLFNQIKKKGLAKRGDLVHLLSSSTRIVRYLNCILVGLPIWFVIGILVTFSPEFGKHFGITEPISAGRSVMYAYTGLVLGDLFSGLLSQRLKSRKIVLLLFILGTGLSMSYFLFSAKFTATEIYWSCFPMGFAVGYWAVFVTNAAEQFGTNLRATVTTTVPNFVRGAVVPITWAFEATRHQWGIISGAFVVGMICVGTALLALIFLKEHFSKDLDFID